MSSHLCNKQLSGVYTHISSLLSPDNESAPCSFLRLAPPLVYCLPGSLKDITTEILSLSPT
jgi:hypothetical protein